MKDPNLQPRLLIADDHVEYRQELIAFLQREGFNVVGSASDGQQAITLARELRPDVALLDLFMPVLNGIDAAKEMRQASPQTKIILLTVHAEVCYVLATFRAGVTGYVLKSRVPESLVHAIQTVSEGALFLSDELHAPALLALLAAIRTSA